MIYFLSFSQTLKVSLMKKNKTRNRKSTSKKRKKNYAPQLCARPTPPIISPAPFTTDNGHVSLKDILTQGIVKNVAVTPIKHQEPLKTPEPEIPVEERYQWDLIARDSQKLPFGDWPGGWQVWLILAGRGFGKTRTGAETIRQWVFQKNCRRLALVAESERDARQVMVEGVSGLLAVHPPHERPDFYPSRGELIWPNGAIATLFSAEAYERLRGPQFDGAWVDELAKFPHVEQVWDQLMFGLRLGKNPQVIVTTTPRPLPLIERLMEAKTTVLTRGSSYDNIQNLAPTFVTQVLERYKNTPLGAQEIFAEIVHHHQQALWTPSMIRYVKPSYFDQRPG
jgi:phage terminase large subunit-like protein